MSNLTILCVSSECKGQPLLVAAQQAGARVLLLTEESKADAPWPMDHIAERFLMPDLRRREDVLNAVSYLTRSQPIDAVVPLDDYEVGLAAALRAHLQLPGMDESTARRFRDKLAMRRAASAAGLTVPAFSGLFNYDRLREYMARVPPPWILKPRFEAGAVGIRKIAEPEQLWRALDELGDLQSYYLLEQFVAGDVYHVDSLWWDGACLMRVASRYGRPPLSVSHEGGVFTTQTLGPDEEDARAVLDLTTALLPALGLRDGAGHTEYIRAADGTFYFLETAARVGGAHISDLVEHTTGVNPWAEWGRIVVARARQDKYQPPAPRDLYGALLICLAQQEWPDLSTYEAPEVVWRLRKPYHAGLILAAEDEARVAQLLETYAARFARGLSDHRPAAGPQSDPGMTMTRSMIPGVRHLVAVASGKGGVGKTTVTVNLALALQHGGATVGIFDADIYGPNVPLMLGIRRRKPSSGFVPLVRRPNAAPYVDPLERFGLRIMSTGLLIGEEQVINPPVGAAGQLVLQTMRDVKWGELDYLLLDLPPSAGEPQETLVGRLQLNGVVIVTTPQDLSLLDASRSLRHFSDNGVPVLGVVENMSYFTCPDCGGRHEIFERSDRLRCEMLQQAPLLGRIPLDTAVSRGINRANPLMHDDPDGPHAAAFLDAAAALRRQLAATDSHSDAAVRGE